MTMKDNTVNMDRVVDFKKKFTDINQVIKPGMRDKMFPSFLTDDEIMTLLSLSYEANHLSNHKWRCLLGAYLADDENEFERMCEEWDVGVNYAKYYCHLAVKYIPRKERGNDTMNRVIPQEEIDEIRTKWGYYEQV